MKGKMKMHHKKEGGRIDMKVSGNPDVFKEAEDKEEGGSGDEKKKGGRVKRKKGGAVTKSVGFMTGGAVKPRADRPARKRGGRVGSDKSPLSSAHGSSAAGKAPMEEEGGQPD